MGLDMYLNKFPRYKKVTVKQICAIDHYFDWLDAKARDEANKSYSFKEWCGCDFDDLPSIEAIEFYRDFYTKKYQTWDTEHKYGHAAVYEQVGYWRKANAIHNWFVNHVQDGEDDCCYHQEVTRGVLEDLLRTCEKVIASCDLVDGKIENGIYYENGESKIDYIDGQYVKDPSVADELLPSTSGFFFGSTDYDMYYVQDIQDTIDIVTRVLETTDFDKEMLYYVSSW